MDYAYALVICLYLRDTICIFKAKFKIQIALIIFCQCGQAASHDDDHADR